MNGQYFNEVELTAIAAEGKAIGKINDKIVFVSYGAKGDVVNVRITKDQRRFYEAEITEVIKKSDDRVEPMCAHFGNCGGCKWQHVNYTKQLDFKQQQVQDALERIGKVTSNEFRQIMGVTKTYNYRNKAEFSFSNKQWLTFNELKDPSKKKEHNSLGFHVPGRFDSVLDINQCHLLPDFNNQLRSFVKEKAAKYTLSFYDVYAKHGDLRSLLLRCNQQNEWMVLIQFGSQITQNHLHLLNDIKNEFPEIKSLLYAVNLKLNDSIYDLTIETFHGNTYLLETLEAPDFKPLQFSIAAKSFFQTNTTQAQQLYAVALQFASLTGNEIVYDLYTGTGTIANFLALKAKHVVGIESVPQAVEDAIENSKRNNIKNTTFLVGDMKTVLQKEFTNTYGKPHVIVTDPPRAGMHNDVIDVIKELTPERIVYVSCNPATQARDVALLNDTYYVAITQPVDMFPHTHHVECVMLLMKR